MLCPTWFRIGMINVGMIWPDGPNGTGRGGFDGFTDLLSRDQRNMILMRRSRS
jgi:hypothetical protein